ncbi:MAG TPA: hypothetical protein VFO40_10410, partial [Chthoniobacterales bacterium]|nr:hypothetical protein [Chthoniobacterales bacterium]
MTPAASRSSRRYQTSSPATLHSIFLCLFLERIVIGAPRLAISSHQSLFISHQSPVTGHLTLRLGPNTQIP